MAWFEDDSPRYSDEYITLVEVLSEKTVLDEANIVTGKAKYEYGMNHARVPVRVGEYCTTKATHLYVLEIIPAPEVNPGQIRYLGFWVGDYIHHDNYAYM